MCIPVGVGGLWLVRSKGELHGKVTWCVASVNNGVLELKATSGANKAVGYVVSCCRRVKGAVCGVSSSLGCRCEGDKNHS